MADGDFLDETEAGAGEEAQAGKKPSLLQSALLNILKWVALGLGAVLFIVTVVFFSVNIILGDNRGQTFLAASEQYVGRGPALEWYREIGEVRGRTADEVPHTVMVEVHLGYRMGDRRMNIELGQRTPEIRDLLRRYFTSRKASELRPAYEDAIKEDLKNRINSIIEGRIEMVIFDNLTVVDF